ncbi:Predicted nucleotide-binding protein [Burkholderia pseudomallei]|uniref:PIN domain-containing protein n=1 Tax=Burkholderia TaxID=32008 RepID=UPI00031F6B71|nr:MULTISPECIES: PIN domain-containing protein [Burkholderia]AIO84516.1 PIN domain protein [Burkholderia pseudomallei]AIP45150.1 PIN domain protein [Burkholderia pseudomallei MSHR5858]MBF3439206.1 hypothetical protein [Burkholderia pseudomallei]MBF3487204.1 hypothetical protein [Burkholderia pseudomallei]MBF3493073.1 hypothetical protein [Burkholderia pseudomallei]
MQSQKALEDVIRSDDLVWLREFADGIEHLSVLAPLFQINLIIDANIILGELRWVSKRRRNESARSELLEVLEVETVLAYAPTFLVEEVTDHLPDLVKQGCDAEKLIVHWARLKALIKFVDVGGIPENGSDYLDPNDVPYLRLQQKISARILSRDKDIEAMEGQTVPIEILGALRNYARRSAVQLTFQVGGYTITGVSLRVFLAIIQDTFPKVKQAASRLPKEFWYAAAACMCVALIHPTSRQWMSSRVSGMRKRIGPSVGGALDVAMTLFTEYGHRRVLTDEALASVYELLRRNVPDSPSD